MNAISHFVKNGNDANNKLARKKGVRGYECNLTMC
jgi:hypothetical protein